MNPYPGFIGPSYVSESKIAADDRCVNLYPETIEVADGKNKYALYNTPGFTTLTTLGASPVRGFYTLNGQTFCVAGGNLYELTISGFGQTATITAATLRGSGMNNPDNGVVTMASNGDGGFQLLITSGSFAYVYDLRTRVLAQVLDDAAQVGFIDGFFITLSPASSSFRISALEDGSSWDATQIAQRNDAADKWAAMLVFNKELWLFGTQTTAVWYNAGLSPFPFAPNPSVYIQYGIAAPFSAAVLDNAPMFLGQSLDGGAMVYRADGYTPRRVSNHAMEYQILQYPTVADAEAYVYQESGHSFYVLTFPTAKATWVYDAATGMWHERGDWNGYAFTGLSTRGHVFAQGAHLTGDRTTGAVYRTGIDVATSTAGAGLRRVRRAPHLYQNGALLGFDRFQLDLEVGLGLTTGQGSAPIANLRWSNDGGQTWSPYNPASVGPRGAYTTRAIWRRLGMARDRVFEVAMSDPVPWHLVNAFVDVRGEAKAA